MEGGIRTRIIRVDPVRPDSELLRIAAETIRRGGLVVFPTETVYGLGANAYDREAVIKVFKVKGRPMDNPLIVHICKLKQLFDVVSEVNELALRIAERLWPGPITIILPKSSSVPDEVTAKLPTVAVRMPAHPVALKLIELSDVPIAAPSANLAGRPSPTTPEHVIKDMSGRVDIIIDAGETLLGVESTIIDLTRRPPVLLRPGPLPVEDLERALGVKVVIPDFARGLSEYGKALSPGIKYRHYAPEKPLVVVESEDYRDLGRYASKVIEVARNYLAKGVRVVILASRETSGVYLSKGFKVVVLGSRANLYEVARNLFKTLRLIDELDIDIAISEGFEERGLGLAIMNRLRKASGYRVIRV